MKERKDDSGPEEDHTTTIKAYDENDSYNDIVSGHAGLDKFDAKHEQCSICNLVATNKRELEDHVRHAHGSQT